MAAWGGESHIGGGKSINSIKTRSRVMGGKPVEWGRKASAKVLFEMDD